MAIIRVKIDGKGPYNFILDSGVGVIIITDPSLVDSVGIPTHRSIKLTGLGDGKDLEAMINSNLTLDIDGVIGTNFSAAVLNKDQFGLSNYAGMNIHGLIGYDFFNSLAVRFNFMDSTLVVAKPGTIKGFKRGYKVPLTIEQNKPYMDANITFESGKTEQMKLLIDLGAGHPLMLENRVKNNSLPQKFIHANLGVGLTGPVSGLLSRVTEADIGKYVFKQVITSFPVPDSDKAVIRSVTRDGSIGLGLLKKFTFVLDYQNSAMYLRPTFNMKTPFEHDMSGMEYYADGDNYKAIIINRVEPGSSADEIGLRSGDAIIAINFKPVANMSIQDVDDILKSGNDRSLLLDILRDSKRSRYIITLKRRI